jgi:hypothetical protein
MIWSMSSGGRVMSAAFWCCSEDMIVGVFDLTGYRMGWRILIRMREVLCYRSLICLQSLGVVEGCSTIMA